MSKLNLNSQNENCFDYVYMLPCTDSSMPCYTCTCYHVGTCICPTIPVHAAMYGLIYALPDLYMLPCRDLYMPHLTCTCCRVRAHPCPLTCTCYHLGICICPTIPVHAAVYGLIHVLLYLYMLQCTGAYVSHHTSTCCHVRVNPCPVHATIYGRIYVTT